MFSPLLVVISMSFAVGLGIEAMRREPALRQIITPSSLLFILLSFASLRNVPFTYELASLCRHFSLIWLAHTANLLLLENFTIPNRGLTASQYYQGWKDGFQWSMDWHKQRCLGRTKLAERR